MSTETKSAKDIKAERLAAQQKKLESKKAVSEFLSAELHAEREAEIHRVTAAFRLNPFDVLGLRTDSTSQDVKKKFRELSRLVHPDKCRKEIREEAQKAFAKLSTAKTDLLDEKKREDLNKIVFDARQRVITRLHKEIKRKRREEAKLAKEAGDDQPRPKEPLPDVTREKNFDDLVKAETQEILIEQEWKKRQMTKAAQEEDKKLQSEKEELEKKRKEAEEEKKKWDEGRDARVTDWRKFMKGNAKGSKKKKRNLNMPKMYQVDQDKTYIKRVKKQDGSTPGAPVKESV